MNLKLMINYINYFNNNQSRDLTIFIYNSSKSHLELEESVKTKFCDNNINLAVIPDGLTSCQLLNITINKLFKDNLCKKWHLWIANGNAKEITAENLRFAK